MALRIAIAVGLMVGLVETPHVPSGQSDTQAIRDMATTIQSTQSKYVGMWVTLDGHVRHQLLPNGRYDEARGSRQSAYRGRYVIRGNHIDYWDDTGFTADGTFVSDDELHHGGMIFRRER